MAVAGNYALMRLVGDSSNDNSMLESIYEYCRGKAFAEEGFPFDQNTLVFKVSGKIFILLSLEATPLQINLKCNPLRAIELRENHSSVIPGYHMNKKHWNTVILDGSISNSLIFDMINHSYELVVNGLSKTQKEAIQSV